MTISISLVPWVVALIGALVYGFLSGNVKELGRLAFLAGLAAALFTHGHC